MSGRSGVIVRIRLPPELEELRQHHDPMAPFGVPAHVTLLYPFLPSADLTPAVRRRIARLTRDVRPFDVALRADGAVPGCGLAGARTCRAVRRPDRAPRRRIPGSPALRGCARRDRPAPHAWARRRERPRPARTVGPRLSAVPGARPLDRGDRRERNRSLAPPLADPVGACRAGRARRRRQGRR